MRMKVQFKALPAFTFFLGVIFECRNAFTNAQYLDFQDQGLPPFGKVPYRIRCHIGFQSTSDSVVSYPTTCSIEPIGKGSSYMVNPLASVFGIQNHDAVNTPFNAELSHLPDTAQFPILSFFTGEPIPLYLTGKPPEVQNTFSYRQGDVNQGAPYSPHSFLSDSPPFQRFKQSWQRNDESENYSSAKRNKIFANKNWPSEATADSNNPFRKYKLMHSMLFNKDPNHSSGNSLHKERENELTKPQLHSSAGNRPLSSFSSTSSETPESFPSTAFVEDPLSHSFSEEYEDYYVPQDLSSPFFSEEQEYHFFPQDPSWPSSSVEQQDSFSPQDLSSPYFSEEVYPDGRKDLWWPYFPEEEQPYSHEHFSPLTYSPREPGDSSSPLYTPYAESPAPAYWEPDDTPFTKPLPNEEPDYNGFLWGNRHMDDEDFSPLVFRRKPKSIFSKIAGKLKRIFHLPLGVETRED